MNKVSTKVQLSFDIQGSWLLTAEEKTILLNALGSKLSAEGLFQIVVQEERSQLGNKEIAIKKLYHVFNKCFVAKKVRKPTKPSKAAKEKRLQSKKHKSNTKQNRRISLD